MLQKRVAEIALINIDRIPSDRAGLRVDGPRRRERTARRSSFSWSCRRTRTPRRGLISTTSPIGRAFLNKEAGRHRQGDDARRHARVRDRQAADHPRRSAWDERIGSIRRATVPAAELLFTATSHRARPDRHRHGRRVSRGRAARAARGRRQARHRRRPRRRRRRRAVCGDRRRAAAVGREGLLARARRESFYGGVDPASPHGRSPSRSPLSPCRSRAVASGSSSFPIDFLPRG